MVKNNNVAIVTGASGGIGRAVAIRLARDGFAVVAHYSGNAKKAEEAVAEITSTGETAIAVQADVASAADVERLLKKTLETYGGIQVVVNCAGIMPLSPIAEGDLASFHKVIATKRQRWLRITNSLMWRTNHEEHCYDYCRIECHLCAAYF